MSPRTRIFVIAGAAAAVAAGATVALAVITSSDEGGQPRAAEAPLAGAPPLVLDLGVRVDPEARALRRAERLYSPKRRPRPSRIFRRYRVSGGPGRRCARGLAGLEPGDDGASGRGAAARLARPPAPRLREPLVGEVGGSGGGVAQRLGGAAGLALGPAGRRRSPPGFPAGPAALRPELSRRRPEPRPARSRPPNSRSSPGPHGVTMLERSFATASPSSASGTESPPGASSTPPPGWPRGAPTRRSPQPSAASTRAGPRPRSHVSAPSRAASHTRLQFASTSGSCFSGSPGTSRAPSRRESASFDSRRPRTPDRRWRGKQSGCSPV